MLEMKTSSSMAQSLQSAPVVQGRLQPEWQPKQGLGQVLEPVTLRPRKGSSQCVPDQSGIATTGHAPNRVQGTFHALDRVHLSNPNQFAGLWQPWQFRSQSDRQSQVHSSNSELLEQEFYHQVGARSDADCRKYFSSYPSRELAESFHGQSRWPSRMGSYGGGSVQSRPNHSNMVSSSLPVPTKPEALVPPFPLQGQIGVVKNELMVSESYSNPLLMDLRLPLICSRGENPPHFRTPKGIRLLSLSGKGPPHVLGASLDSKYVFKCSPINPIQKFCYRFTKT